MKDLVWIKSLFRCPRWEILDQVRKQQSKIYFPFKYLMVFYRSGVIIKNFPKSSFQIWWHLEFTVDKFILWASSWHLVLLNVKSCSVTFQGLRHWSTFIITHTPLFQGGAAYVVMNIHNPIHALCYVTIRVQTGWRHNAEQSFQRSNNNVQHRITLLHPFWWQVSPRFSNAMEQIANLKKLSNFVVSNSLGKHNLNSVWMQYVCDKSENAWVCASPVVQSSNTVSCVSLSFCTPT